MSKIAEQIQKLKEQELRLQRETRKVEFLNHILQSAQDYNHKAFADVKDDVLALLAAFVGKAIEAIETGTKVEFAAPMIQIAPQTPAAPAQPQVTAPTQVRGPAELSPAEKLNFAMENRHLGGKTVSVMNDKNIQISGKVVGLDAPFVLVKTDTGPTIKVPLDKVSL